MNKLDPTLDATQFEDGYSRIKNSYRTAIFPSEPAKPNLEDLDSVKSWILEQTNYLEDLNLARTTQSLYDNHNSALDDELDLLKEQFTGINMYNISKETKAAILNKAWNDKHSDGEKAVIFYTKYLLNELFFDYRIKDCNNNDC
jgi:hypothetical protein